MSSVDEAVAAIEAGLPVVLPTDTVYGICSAPDEEAVRALYRAKGRDEGKPTALVAAGFDELGERLPELDERTIRIMRALLPGPYTLVVPNPARRFAWLSRVDPAALGVRIPALTGAAADVLRRVGAVAATSANLPGAPDPRRVEELGAELRCRVAAVLDGGNLPGTASTVVDVAGAEPRVLREGAVPAAEALARIAAAAR